MCLLLSVSSQSRTNPLETYMRFGASCETYCFALWSTYSSTSISTTRGEAEGRAGSRSNGGGSGKQAAKSCLVFDSPSFSVWVNFWRQYWRWRELHAVTDFNLLLELHFEKSSTHSDAALCGAPSEFSHGKHVTVPETATPASCCQRFVSIDDDDITISAVSVSRPFSYREHSTLRVVNSRAPRCLALLCSSRRPMRSSPSSISTRRHLRARRPLALDLSRVRLRRRQPLMRMLRPLLCGKS